MGLHRTKNGTDITFYNTMEEKNQCLHIDKQKLYTSNEYRTHGIICAGLGALIVDEVLTHNISNTVKRIVCAIKKPKTKPEETEETDEPEK